MASSAEEEEDTAKHRVGRACDRCRVRKIRCDRLVPCSSCTTAGITCVNTSTSKPRPSQGSRVIISKEYEHKIDAIEQRLDGIERMLATSNRLLEKMLASQSTTTPSQAHSHRDDVIIGDTSLLAHSRHARQVLEERLRASPMISGDPDVAAALVKLRAAMQKQQVKRVRDESMDLHPLPPYALFVHIVQQARTDDARFFAVWSPFMSPETFLDMVTQLYQDPGSCSIARRILAFGTILYMFVENMAVRKAALQEYIGALSHNLWVSLQQYHTCATATYENILAACFAAAHAIQIQDYSLAWTFNALSSRMCQDLGWHRNQDDQACRILFWIMYYTDKCLSLRFGRSSTIQDYDITVGLPDDSADPRYRGWSTWLRSTVEIGRIHGLIYEKLYSPGSFSKIDDVRIASAQEIVAMLPPASIEPGFATYDRPYLLHLNKANEVVTGCLLTLIYRAVSAELTDRRCLSAARATIRSHLELTQMAQERDTTDYATWTLLNCPFTPFIVLFSSVIVDLEEEDLRLMKEFVDSLDKLSTRSAESIAQFGEFCKAFYTLADHYVRASARTEVTLSDVDGNIDMETLMPILPSALFDSWLAGSQDFLWDGAV